MLLSSEFCRAQELAQRNRAAESSLDRVRALALAAADAWHTEAEEAERREHRHAAVKRASTAAQDDKSRTDELVDAMLDSIEDRNTL